MREGTDLERYARSRPPLSQAKNRSVDIHTSTPNLFQFEIIGEPIGYVFVKRKEMRDIMQGMNNCVAECNENRREVGLYHIDLKAGVGSIVWGPEGSFRLVGANHD